MENSANGIIEIFSINLKPGTGALFHKTYIERSLPLQKQFNVDLVVFGPSLHDADSYLVVRHYRDLSHRQQSQEAFYKSDEWKKGPREAILSLIENYSTIVVPASEALLLQLRTLKLPAQG